jgi:hypothetical protein
MARPGDGLAKLVVGVVVFVAVAFCSLIPISLLGVATGALGMCSTAPAWWAAVYMLLFLLGPPLCGAFAVARVNRGYFPRLK